MSYSVSRDTNTRHVFAGLGEQNGLRFFYGLSGALRFPAPNTSLRSSKLSNDEQPFLVGQNYRFRRSPCEGRNRFNFITRRPDGFRRYETGLFCCRARQISGPHERISVPANVGWEATPVEALAKKFGILTLQKQGISSRGMGSVREDKGMTIVEDDFQLICFDFHIPALVQKLFQFY